MNKIVLSGLSLVLMFLLSTHATAAVINPDELILQGDLQVGVNDSLGVTAKFNGTFSSISSVQIIMYLSNYYSYGESYRFTFFDDLNNTVSTVSHLNSDPVNLYSHIGYLTNSNIIENQFADGKASFELVMLSGSATVSSIVIKVSGTFIANSPPADGDLNQDLVVNVVDILLAQRIVTNQLLPSTEQLQQGDVAPQGFPDGQINAADLLLITRKAQGVEVGF